MRRRQGLVAHVCRGFSLGLVLAWTIAGAAHAGGLYVQEFATNSMGTAGAGRGATAMDAGTVLHNTAGMTRLEGHQIWAGFTPGSPPTNSTRPTIP